MKLSKALKIKILKITIVSMILCGIIIGRRYITPITLIQRNTYVDGDKKETLLVTVEDELEQQEIEIEVERKKYSPEELEALFEKEQIQLEKIFLNENESADEVRTDLNLIHKMPDSGVEILWEISDLSLVNFVGELQQEEISQDGSFLEVRATMLCQNKEQVVLFPLMVFPEKETKQSMLIKRIKAEVQKGSEKNIFKDSFALPTSISGKKILWEKPREKIVEILIGLTAAIIVLILIKDKQEEKKKKEQRDKELLLHYPELVHTFSLYLGSGMTPKKAFVKMSEDYKRGKQKKIAYEEILVLLRQIENGYPEKNAYEEYGTRIGLRPYLRFSNLLAQNLTKGGTGLIGSLEEEAREAYEEKKSNCRRLGEEAGTKMLIPMFVMLSIVLIIIVVPAFLSIQL